MSQSTQILDIRDRVVTKGGYLSFRLDRAAQSTAAAPMSSQVCDLLLEVLS